jgi:hypothetical protein
MAMRMIELDLNETGFLCKMIVKCLNESKPLLDAQGNQLWPEWLYKLFQKLAKANDEMMTDLQEQDDGKIH